MKGQVFTIAKLHYINGVVYSTARQGAVDLHTLADNFAETTKSGDVKHPLVRVRHIARFAQGIGLIRIYMKNRVAITDLGRKYYDARVGDKWSLSEAQKELLREHILSNPSRTETIHAIAALLKLTESGYEGMELARQYAIAIGKESAWNSEVTYEGFTQFGLNYLEELGFSKEDTGPPPFENISSNNQDIERKANTFLFTWNPKRWSWDDLRQAVYEANAEGVYLDSWSCGSTRHISPGDRAFLMRLGIPPKGIMGSGLVTSTPYQDLHWDPNRAAHGDMSYYVKIVFDVLSDHPILDDHILSKGKVSEHNWFPQASGTHIPEEIAEPLEVLWSQYTGTSFLPPGPSDLATLHLEGTKRSRRITTYERNKKARTQCLLFHGTRCQVCNLAFEERYSPIGKGFIHVHHVTPVSGIGEEYQVNPVDDLSPICPNCHAMLHQRTPPYTIDELKSIIGGFQNLT